MNTKRKALACASAVAIFACGMARANPPDLLDVLHANHADAERMARLAKERGAGG